MNKSMKAVFSPQKFTPELIPVSAQFEALWESNRPWVLANMAHMAYFEEAGVREFTEALGATTTCYYNEDGAQAYLAIWPDKAVLAFRGSQPMENEPDEWVSLESSLHKQLGQWSELPGLDKLPLPLLNNDVLADLRLIKAPFPSGADPEEHVKVHRGFLTEIDKLWPAIAEDLELHGKDLEQWVTGHSLGAAMATLAGMKHSFNEVVTFGEPRVGSDIDRSFKSMGHQRYVNGADPVTAVPPAKLLGYKHHGVKHRVGDSDGRVDPRFDHSIIYYAENLAD